MNAGERIAPAGVARLPRLDAERERRRKLSVRVNLVSTLARREFAARYRGSMLGGLWALATPMVMIAIYTFIFAGIFGARFGATDAGGGVASGTGWSYALNLYCGLLAWSAFGETLQTSASTILRHANLVKRVVFPLETLPVAHTLAAFGVQICGTVVLLAGVLWLHQGLYVTTLWLPLLWTLQLAATVGAAWLVAALGVFLPDTREVTGLVLMAWMFLTPILYPPSAVPPAYRAFVTYNPWAAHVENYRRILLQGVAPDFTGILVFAVFAFALLLAGYLCFRRARPAFADVV